MSKTRKKGGRALSLLPCAAKCLSFSPSAASFLRSPREAGTFRCRRRGKRRVELYLYYPVPRSVLVFLRLRLVSSGPRERRGLSDVEDEGRGGAQSIFITLCRGAASFFSVFGYYCVCISS